MTRKKSYLGNPAVAIAATKPDVVKKTASFMMDAVKITAIVGGGLLAYRFFSTRFVNKREVSNFPPANITLGQAKSRAASIYKAAGYVYSDFDTIKSQFTIGNGTAVNYNGLVRIYNAFGQVGNMVTGYSDMDAFLNSRLSSEHLLQLRFLTSGNWFKQSASNQNDVITPKPLVNNEVKLIEFKGV